MNYIELAGTYLNLDHVAFFRKEEHAQLGTVVAVHFCSQGVPPLYVGDQHYEELGRLLAVTNGQPQRA